jgi:hypothetical protein
VFALEWDGTTEWSFDGCYEDSGFLACVWDASGDDGGHGVTVEMVVGGSPSVGNVVAQVDFYG